MPIDLREKLGASGFGERYLGLDTASGRELLVTMPRLSARETDSAIQARLIAAVRRYHGLVHPHICALVDVGFTPSGQLVIAQECPKTAGGKAPADDEKEPGREALMHLCEALAYAHARGMVHGALTRDCLLREGPQGARVADFGVGVALYEAGVLGACGEKVPEAAPEVKAGAEPTTASDVYALGIIGIELCAVPSPAGAASTQDSPAETARHIPGAGLAAVLARAIESDPKARQPSAEEMLAQLRKIAIRPPPAPSARVTRKLPTPKPKKEPEPPAVPEMSYLRGLGLLLWGLTRSALILTMALSLIAAAVVGGLALAFRNTPALVTVPDLEGMTVAEATALARAKGLEVTVGREAHHEEVPAGHVIDHSPYPGKMVREGRAVELVVSLGPPRAKVPNLVGKSRAEARDLLTAARLRLGTVSRQARSSKPGDEVLSQNPGPGKEVPIDTEVSLTVSGNRKIASAPGVKGPRAADVAIIVPEGPVVQRVKVEVHYPSGRYEVAYERVCRPGEKVRTHVTASGEATVQVLIDGELVAEYDLEPSP